MTDDIGQAAWHFDLFTTVGTCLAKLKFFIPTVRATIGIYMSTQND